MTVNIFDDSKNILQKKEDELKDGIYLLYEEKFRIQSI